MPRASCGAVVAKQSNTALNIFYADTDMEPASRRWPIEIGWVHVDAIAVVVSASHPILHKDIEGWQGAPNEEEIGASVESSQASVPAALYWLILVESSLELGRRLSCCTTVHGQ